LRRRVFCPISGAARALLTDADVATLKHLVEAGMGDNTLLASDLAISSPGISRRLGGPALRPGG
jgi:hypothetical protein